MRHYQVFLPPPSLSTIYPQSHNVASSSKASFVIPGVKFVDLPPPPNEDGQSLGSLPLPSLSRLRPRPHLLATSTYKGKGREETSIFEDPGEINAHGAGGGDGGSVERSYEHSTILGKRAFSDNARTRTRTRNDDTIPISFLQEEVTYHETRLGARARARARADMADITGEEGDTSAFSWPPTIPPPSAFPDLDPPPAVLLATSNTNTEIGKEEVENGNPLRRRSLRLGMGLSKTTTNLKIRSNASLLGTLPQLDPSPSPSHSRSFYPPALGETQDSLDSTTDTFPSQLPYSGRSPSGPDLMNRSVHHLPAWTIPLNRLTSLQTLLSPSPSTLVSERGARTQGKCTIVCVLSVDQPVVRRRKAEKERGAEGSLWIGKWVVTSPPNGGMGEMSCVVRLWDECAREWGDEQVRRGDVVLLENVEPKPSSNKEPAHLVLTPHNAPRMTILYRTIPRYQNSTKSDYVHVHAPNRPSHDHANRTEAKAKAKMVSGDRALRPDLRVGRSDVGVRKVGEVVRWFAQWVGGEE